MWTASDDLSHATILAAMVRGPDAGDRHVEELFDRFSDVGLRRFRVHAKRVLTTILIRRRGLLGDDRCDDGAGQCRHGLLTLLLFAGGFLGGRLLCALRLWLRGLARGLRSLSRRLVGVGVLGCSLRRLAFRLLRSARLALRLRTRCTWLLFYRGELVAERVGFDEHDIGPEDVVRRDIGVRHHVGPLQVAPAQENVGLKAVRKNQYLLVRHAECPEERDHLLGARRLVVEVVDHDQRILTRARVERALAGECTDLARNGLVVLAAGRTEHCAATDEMRSAARALTGASGSLLLPRLLVATGHETARLGVREPETLVRQIRLNGLVHHLSLIN